MHFPFIADGSLLLMPPTITAPVMILAGGRSPEHEVSMASGDHMRCLLEPICKYLGLIHLLEDGSWKPHHDLGEAFICPDKLMAAYAHHLTGRWVEPSKICAFPVTHGSFGENGSLQGWLEMGGYSYVGSGVLGSAMAMDKVTAKRLFLQLNIPTLPWCEITHSTWKQNSEAALAKLGELSFAGEAVKSWVVKPHCLGSSIGISVAHNHHELMDAVSQAFLHDHTVMVEPYLKERTEIECAVMVGSVIKISEPCEAWTRNEVYSYHHKYGDHTPLGVADYLSDAQRQKLNESVRRVVSAFRLSGLCRMDWFYLRDQGQLYLNEVNTIPGLGPQSHALQLWQLSGADISSVMYELIESSLHGA